MLNFTEIVRPYFTAVHRGLERQKMHPQQQQLRLLRQMLHAARHTEVGQRYGFDRVADYESFARMVPVRGYEEIRPEVMRMVGGEADVLWPGVTRRYAQSSGTADGRSKYIPVTSDSLRQCHYRGATACVAEYLSHHPKSRLFSGRAFILGGSFATALTNLPAGVRVGDLSAHLIQRISPLVNLMRTPSKHTALMADWSEKLPRLVEECQRARVTSLSGVPSWFLTVLRQVLAATGCSSIHQVWPELEVFFHGGISFEPYRRQYEMITDPARMNYLETYNASEGFFAVQDEPELTRAMLLLTDCGVFFEFQPIDRPDEPPVMCHQVEPGRVYALIITSCNGLWRYPIGDTVRVESVVPLRITIAGRTKSFINAFGEELMVHNADAAIAATCHELDCAVADYTAAPVFTDTRTKGHHQWLVEFARRPQSLDEFARVLDRHLCEENSDYAAKRAGGIFLALPEVTEVPHGAFTAYLASTGKLGGQRKMPRLSNDRTVVDAVLRGVGAASRDGCRGINCG